MGAKHYSDKIEKKRNVTHEEPNEISDTKYEK